MYRNVLVAYDGSEGARAALQRAVQIATEDGAAISLVESIDNGGPPIAIGPEAKHESYADARHRLERAIAPLDTSLAASPWIVGAPPAEAILAVADDLDADLIVVGSRGQGRIASAILGGVSSELIRSSPRDVLVVHPG